MLKLRLIILLLFVAPEVLSETEVFRAGFARLAINPEISDTWTDINGNFRFDEKDTWVDGNHNGRFDPIYLAGFGQSRVAQSNHDPIYATACVLELASVRIAIIAIDAIGFMHEELSDLRRRLPNNLQIDYLISHATHNHETPDTLGFWGGSRFRTGVNREYLAFVKQQMLSALELAVQQLTPAKIQAFEAAKELDLDVEDTRPPIVIERGIRVFRFLDSASDKTLGTWVNWSNHVETLWSQNLAVTSDFVHYLREGLENKHAKNPLQKSGFAGITLFLAGNVGGLMTTSPRVTVEDVISGEKIQAPGFEKAKAQGYKLAYHILEGIGSTPYEIPTTLDYQQRKLSIPVDNWKFWLAKFLGVIRRDINWRGHTASEIGALQIGSNQVLLIPGELYPELAIGGIQNPPGADEVVNIENFKPLKDYMKGNVKMIVNLANDSIGYIIPRSQWDDELPWSGPEGKHTYGEVNSMGKETADLIYQGAIDVLKRLQQLASLRNDKARSD